MADDDTLDIEMSLNDFDEMSAEMLLNMWDKLRQSRRDLKTERDQVRENLAERNATVRQLETAVRQQSELIAQRNSVLAEVAMDLIGSRQLPIQMQRVNFKAGAEQ